MCRAASGAFSFRSCICHSARGLSIVKRYRSNCVTMTPLYKLSGLKYLLQAAASAVDDPDISSSAPMEEEVISALKKLKNGKVPGCCNIAPEMTKGSGPAMVTALFQSCWANGTIPEDWKKGIILPLYKGKRSRRDCKNCRGITLLSCPGKLCSYTPRKDLGQAYCNETEGTNWFYTSSLYHRSVFVLNLILQGPLWIAYVDLKAAFHSVDRPALWTLLRSLSIPLKIVSLIRELNTSKLSSVRMERILSDWFEMRSSMRQGAPLHHHYFFLLWIGFLSVLYIEDWQDQVLVMNLSQIWTMQMM